MESEVIDKEAMLMPNMAAAMMPRLRSETNYRRAHGLAPFHPLTWRAQHGS